MSLKRKLDKKRKSKMTVNLPLVKEVEEIRLRDEDDNVVTRKVMTRNDGAVILGILSGVDYNEGSRKKLRRSAQKVMKLLRKFNFDNSLEEGLEGSVSISEDQLEHLYDILVKDTPEKIEFKGVDTLTTLVEFEDFYDAWKARTKAETELDRT